MGRSQKPFVVEVKRGRKGAASGRSIVLPKSLEAAPGARAEARVRPPEPPKDAVKPPRRILDAIEPVPAPAQVLESAVLESAVLETAAVAVDPLKRRRGRPAKTARVPAQESERPVVARKEEAPIARRVRREFVFKPENIVVLAAPPRDVKIALRAHGHVTHVERAEVADSLPRGERWKRRLPKVLW